MTPLKALEHYENCHWIMTDFIIELGKCLQETDKDFVNALSEETRNDIIEKLKDSPSDEEGWSKLRVFCMGAWIGKRDMGKYWAEQKDLLRKGVETLRKLLTENS